MTKISKLQPSQRRQGRWLVFLEGGESLRVEEGDVVSLGLRQGLELDQAALAALTRAARRAHARDKALAFLAARPRSRRELIRHLTTAPPNYRQGSRREPPADDALANEVADWLEEYGYLNDAEYAHTVVRHYAAKNYGVRRIRDELFRRGVPREYWQEALDEWEAADDTPAQLDAFLCRRFAHTPCPDRAAQRKAADLLARRGYRWEEIDAALQRYSASSADSGAQL